MSNAVLGAWDTTMNKVNKTGQRSLGEYELRQRSAHNKHTRNVSYVFYVVFTFTYGFCFCYCQLLYFTHTVVGYFIIATSHMGKTEVQRAQGICTKSYN